MPVPQSTTPINRPTVRQIAFQKLRDWIEDGTLAPGEVIRDVEIADRLGVSRTPVREALQMLEQLGAIETLAGRHTRVSIADAQDAERVFAPLAVLHAVASELATPKATKADLKAMRKANERLAQAVEDEDPVAARQADDAFHEVLLRRADNPFLEAAIEPLQHHARRLDSLYFSHRTASQTSIDLHDEIIAAVEAGDAARAYDATRRNWQQFKVVAPQGASR